VASFRSRRGRQGLIPSHAQCGSLLLPSLSPFEDESFVLPFLPLGRRSQAFRTRPGFHIHPNFWGPFQNLDVLPSPIRYSAEYPRNGSIRPLFFKKAKLTTHQ
jgi:hypothetical protein